MKAIWIIAICLLSLQLAAQKTFNGVKKISNAKGTFWGYWGYNRSAYSKSDLTFKGHGYDFTLSGASASDNPSKKFTEYVSLKTITVPQFNVRFGYYFTNKYALSIGYDHMKYLFDDANHVLLNGHIQPGLDSTWSGDYVNQEVVTNRNNFHYENSNGLNYIRLQVTRTDKFYQTRDKRFALSSNLSLGTGCVLTINDFLFAEKFDRYTASISGYGISGHASLRFEFFRHVFIQPEISGGSINLSHVRNRKEDKTAYTQQQFWYGQRNLVVGFFYYFKPKNACQDCPVW